MLGPHVGVAAVYSSAPAKPLWPTEASAIARAVPKRQLEFATGRTAARRAMADLDLPPVAIMQGSDRAPVWPTGLTGSIAHCDDICIAAVARLQTFQSLGLDIEPATPLDHDLWDLVCLPPERAWLNTQRDPGIAAKLIFSAKEAVYKAQYPLTGQIIAFDAVELHFSSKQPLFEITVTTLPHALIGHFRSVGAHILCTCAKPALYV